MKRTLFLILALIMCLSLVPLTTFAIEENYVLRWDMGTTDNNPVFVKWSIETQTMQVTYIYSGNFFQLRDAENPDEDQKTILYIKDVGNWKEIAGITSKIVGVDDERSGTWNSKMYSGEEGYSGSPTYHTIYLQFYKDGKVFSFDSGVEYGIYFEIYTDGYPHGSMPDDIFGFGNPITSDWALSEIGKADSLGLIPETLKGADLSQPITRAEFAAVTVKVFENLTDTKTTPSSTSTFTDTTDAEVLKAHNTNLMIGVSATEFEPNTLLNREQAATALTRVLKRANIPGWTFPTDGQYKLNFTRPATFADDAQISDWAKESVYFMAANDIIKGVGENKFAPKAVTSAEQATGYATATREQAIIIGLRLVESLKDKPIDYTQG